MMKVSTSEPTVTLLRRHLETLMRVAEDAERRADHTEAEYRMTIDQLQGLTAQLTNQVQALERRVTDYQTANATMRRQVHECDLALREADAYITQLQDERDALRTELEHTKG